MLSNNIYQLQKYVKKKIQKGGINMRHANKDIYDYARIKDVRMWRIAQVLEMHDSNLSRMLRKELPANKKEQIKRIIDKLTEE